MDELRAGGCRANDVIWCGNIASAGLFIANRTNSGILGQWPLNGQGWNEPPNALQHLFQPSLGRLPIVEIAAILSRWPEQQIAMGGWCDQDSLGGWRGRRQQDRLDQQCVIWLNNQ